MRGNGSLKRNGSNLTQNHRWVKSQPKVLVASQRWPTRTQQRVDLKASRGSRPLLTTPEREPWSRQNLMRRQNEPNQHQLVHHPNSEKKEESKSSGGCGIMIVRGLLLILHTLYWVSAASHFHLHFIYEKNIKTRRLKIKQKMR